MQLRDQLKVVRGTDGLGPVYVNWGFEPPAVATPHVRLSGVLSVATRSDARWTHWPGLTSPALVARGCYRNPHHSATVAGRSRSIGTHAPGPMWVECRVWRPYQVVVENHARATLLNPALIDQEPGAAAG